MDFFNKIELFKDVSLNRDWQFIFEGNTFESILLVVVSFFTDNWRIMSMVWGFIIGYLNIKIIWHVIDNTSQKFNSYSIKILIVFLVCSMPFWNIGIFRFFTASNLFIYGLLKYFENDKWFYLLVSTLAVFVHWSFIFVLIIISLFLLLKKLDSKKINYNVILLFNVIFLISIFHSFFEDFSSITNLKFDYLPQFFNQKASGYSSEIFVNRLEDMSLSIDNNFYVKWRYNLIFILVQFIFLFYLRRRNSVIDFLKIDFYFILVFTFYFIYNQLGTFSPFDRYAYISNFFVAYLIFLFLDRFKNFKNFMPYRYLSVFVLLYVVVEIRNSFDTISILTVASSPLLSPFLLDYNFSLIDMFK
tara:strand:- start:4737 stop:5813 length:1077 start_codon:yes stop_codon:yes gene_type:complete